MAQACVYLSELSMGWVDPWVGLGRDFSVFGGLNWVGSTTAKVLKIERITLMHEFGRVESGRDDLASVPSVYVLNAAALSKPHAIQLLKADLISYNCDTAVVTETRFKKKQADGVVTVPGYILWRHDGSAGEVAVWRYM